MQTAPQTAERARTTTAVMSFSGCAVADPDRIRQVAARLVERHARGICVVAVVSAMDGKTAELMQLAGQVSDVPDPRELDVLLSAGERVSCALLAMAINDLGHEAISLTGSQAGIITDAAHGGARIVDVRSRRVSEALDRGRIVLVAGLQGMSGDARNITTLGPGGGEMSAIAIAAELGAAVCEIFADPRALPDFVGDVGYDSMIELCRGGVAMPALGSVELAKARGVRMHVRSAFSESPGIRVVPPDEVESEHG
jgi:aspartate kinase